MAGSNLGSKETLSASDKGQMDAVYRDRPATKVFKEYAVNDLVLSDLSTAYKDDCACVLPTSGPKRKAQLLNAAPDQLVDRLATSLPRFSLC